MNYFLVMSKKTSGGEGVFLLARNCESGKLLTIPRNFAQFRAIPHNCMQLEKSYAQRNSNWKP